MKKGFKNSFFFHKDEVCNALTDPRFQQENDQVKKKFNLKKYNLKKRK